MSVVLGIEAFGSGLAQVVSNVYFITLLAIATLIGAAPTIIAVISRYQRQRPIHRFFALAPNTPMTVMATASHSRPLKESPEFQIAYTGVGQIRAMASLSQFLARFYPNKSLSILLSGQTSGSLEDDIVCIGGPAKNDFTRFHLKLIQRQAPDLRIILDDAEQFEIGIEDFKRSIRWSVQPVIPEESDYALIVVGPNLASHNRSSRVIICAGLTSFGTEGGAQWMFEQLISSRNKQLFRDLRVRQSPNAVHAFILEVQMNRPGADSKIGITGSALVMYSSAEINPIPELSPHRVLLSSSKYIVL